MPPKGKKGKGKGKKQPTRKPQQQQIVRQTVTVNLQRTGGTTKPKGATARRERPGIPIGMLPRAPTANEVAYSLNTIQKMQPQYIQPTPLISYQTGGGGYGGASYNKPMDRKPPRTIADMSVSDLQNRLIELNPQSYEKNILEHQLNEQRKYAKVVELEMQRGTKTYPEPDTSGM